jgi:hypothetical protein
MKQKIKLCAQFEANLKTNYGLSLTDISDSIFVGKVSSSNSVIDSGSKYVDYTVLYPDIQRPSYTKNCICGHAILINHHIYSKSLNKVFALGSECVIHFTATGNKRVCVKCNSPNMCHGELCSICRDAAHKCPDCGKKCEYKYKRCYRCNMKVFTS